MKIITLIISIMLIVTIDVMSQIKSVESLGLKGKILKVLENYYQPEVMMGEIESKELVGKRIYEFYEEGKLKSELFYGMNFNLTRKNNYSLKGNLISIYNSFDNNGKPIEKDSFIYNLNGTIGKMIEMYFDKDKEFEPEKKWIITGTYIYNYFENGNLKNIEYTYNENGGDHPCIFCNYLTIENEESNKSNFGLNLNDFNEESFWSNIDGILIPRKNLEHPYGEYIKKVKFDYEYDNNNNWIKCTVLRNDTPYMIVNREISYY